MKKYKVICFPNQNRYATTVEAESVDEAILIATEEANENCGFYADENDVTEINFSI